MLNKIQLLGINNVNFCKIKQTYRISLYKNANGKIRKNMFIRESMRYCHLLYEILGLYVRPFI